MRQRKTFAKFSTNNNIHNNISLIFLLQNYLIGLKNNWKFLKTTENFSLMHLVSEQIFDYNILTRVLQWTSSEFDRFWGWFGYDSSVDLCWDRDLITDIRCKFLKPYCVQSSHKNYILFCFSRF